MTPTRETICTVLREMIGLMPTGACSDGKGAERDAAQDRAIALLQALEAPPRGWDRETICTVLSEMIGSLDHGYSPGRTGFDG
jgi:hypothetical protein